MPHLATIDRMRAFLKKTACVMAFYLFQLVLLFSSLDEAISLNLLTTRFNGLLQAYTALRQTLEDSGLFLEVSLNGQADIGLVAVKG